MNRKEIAMSHNQFTRRRLLQSAAAGATLGFWTSSEPRGIAAETTNTVKITDPFHGAVLNHRHGKQTADGLTIHVAGRCRLGDRVTVNGLPCRVQGERFDTDVVLRGLETDLVAVGEQNGDRREDRVRVVWDRYSVPRYNFAVDDNIFFLRDIARKKYASLFDCFYLKMFRDLHEKYGTRFALNIYFAADDDFSLPQFPDHYKSEWKDNAGWLKLAFHAYANSPDRPYQDAPAAKLLADYDKVAEEIHRFAGEDTFAPPTNIHFAMVTPEAIKALHGRGVRALSGYFAKINGRWDINYGFDAERSEYLLKHDVLMDFDSRIVFFRDAIVCNETPVDRVAPTLDPLYRESDRRDTINLLTHEQYTWPFYHAYVPDHAQRIETAIRWCTERGYKPVFFHEGLLGGRV
jgi:hypothetical protein